MPFISAVSRTIGTEPRHRRQKTLSSIFFCAHSGIFSHRRRASGVNGSPGSIGCIIFLFHSVLCDILHHFNSPSRTCLDSKKYNVPFLSLSNVTHYMGKPGEIFLNLYFGSGNSPAGRVPVRISSWKRMAIPRSFLINSGLRTGLVSPGSFSKSKSWKLGFSCNFQFSHRTAASDPRLP